MEDNKPGWKSTEFLQSLIHSGIGLTLIVLAVFYDTPHSEFLVTLGAGLIGVEGAGYKLARTWLKVSKGRQVIGADKSSDKGAGKAQA